ncbi:hypothetical protein [Candidatus Nitrospira salsa]|nr:MAG: hypothetical protein NPIRA01_14350 [Nitrospirales bacterium]
MLNTIASRKHALEQKVEELEETLLQLKQQLKKEREAEQHEAIEQLEVYLDQVNNKYSNLQGFWQLLRKEISELLAVNSQRK